MSISINMGVAGNKILSKILARIFIWIMRLWHRLMFKMELNTSFFRDKNQTFSSWLRRSNFWLFATDDVFLPTQQPEKWKIMPRREWSCAEILD